MTLAALAIACLNGSAHADQCYETSDPLRLTPLEQRSVVLNRKDNPDVFGTQDFSLKRTLEIILSSTPGAEQTTIEPAKIEAFLDTLLAGLKADEIENRAAEITYKVEKRPGEDGLTAKDLLSDGPHKMIPVGLFNRLDLTPGDFSNCGEFRIVYAKTSDNFDDRLTLIFEAALANPDASGDKAQCQAAWGLWKSFSEKAGDKPKLSDKDIGQRLAQFYFTGGPIGGSQTFRQVMHYEHLGLRGGQVRANAFVGPAENQNWHLRQWRVFFDANSPGAAAKFDAMPLNENPVPGFFGGDLPTSSDAAKTASFAGLFQNTFVRTNIPQIVAVDSLAAIPVPPRATVATLIDNVGVDIDDRFYAVDSDAGPFGEPAADDPATRVAPGSPGFWQGIADRLTSLKVAQACGITPAHVLNRMGAMTCGGCHQFSNGKEIAPGIRWPISLNFVHIDEEGRLSALLLDRFLPFRFHLMDKIVPTAPPLPQVLTVGQNALTLREFANKRFQLTTELQGLSTAKTAAKLEGILRLSQQIRQFDSSQEGAFVTFRKPD